MDSLNFLDTFPDGSACIMIQTPQGKVTKVNGVHPDIIGLQCPLLQLSFEEPQHGCATAMMEAPSSAVAISFLRFLYLGDYVEPGAGAKLDRISLLLHVELLRMAKFYAVPELATAACVNIIDATEMSCSNPNPLPDLCPAIRLAYNHLPSDVNLKDTLLQYCVNCFQQHRLGSDADFRELAMELPRFSDDLARLNYRRNFQDDCASEIVRLNVRLEPLPNCEAIIKFFEELTNARRAESKSLPNQEVKRHNSKSIRDDLLQSQQPYIESTGHSRKNSTDADGFVMVHRPKTEKEPSIGTEDFHSRSEPMVVPDPRLGVGIIAAELEKARKAAAEELVDSERHDESEWSLIFSRKADLECSDTTLKGEAKSPSREVRQWGRVDFADNSSVSSAGSSWSVVSHPAPPQPRNWDPLDPDIDL